MDFDCIYKSYYLDVYHFLCGLSSNKRNCRRYYTGNFYKKH